MADPETRGVLVVEDESIVAHDIQQTLTDLGYDAFSIAASAEEAMARAAERRPDLALVDIRIKGKLDGIKTAQLLKERFGVPIVYLSAHADDATLERATQTGPYGYLVKPVKPAELRSTIEVALQRHRMDTPKSSSARPTAPRPKAQVVRAPGVRAVRRQLAQILKSADFDASRRSREFLSFIVEEALAGRGEVLSQSAIATRVFGRRDDFDAIVDPIVRIQAGRLRRSLERYYLLAGRHDPVRIELHRGAYLPAFRRASTRGTESAETEAAAKPAIEETVAVAEPAVESWPTVGVRPFEAAGAEPELASHTPRFNDELEKELGRYRDLRIVRLEKQGTRASRTESRFTLHGSIRVASGGWEVTARLEDSTNAEQLWMDAYYTTAKAGRRGGSLEDVARVIAARVGSEEGVVVQTLAAELALGKPVGPPACVAILRSYRFFFAREGKSFAEVLDALRQAVTTDPESSLAWTRLARLYLANATLELAKVDTPLEDALTCAQNGVRLDPTSRRARCILAAIWLVKGELAAARYEAQEALRLSSDSLVYLEMIGWVLTLAGDWDRGAALVREAVERNPHHLPYVNHALWADHLRRDEFTAAYEAAMGYRDGAFYWRPMMRACCLGHLGRAQDARPEVAELLRQKPDFPSRGRTLIGHYIKFEDIQERIADGLRRAHLRLD
ncbi:MAG TPA: response regulator [Vicinamibacteria bacterium]|nr:response regulator [Vicinamibacteria bacterium]